MHHELDLEPLDGKNKDRGRKGDKNKGKGSSMVVGYGSKVAQANSAKERRGRSLSRPQLLAKGVQSVDETKSSSAT